MRNKITVLLLGLLAGCSSAPRPVECHGEFRPVNIKEQKNASFDGNGRMVKCGEGMAHVRQG